MWRSRPFRSVSLRESGDVIGLVEVGKHSVQTRPKWFGLQRSALSTTCRAHQLGSENYWEGWPSFDDNYGVLHPWQQEFLKIVTRLEAN